MILMDRGTSREKCITVTTFDEIYRRLDATESRMQAAESRMQAAESRAEKVEHCLAAAVATRDRCEEVLVGQSVCGFYF